MSHENAAQGGRCRVILLALASVLTLVGGCAEVKPVPCGCRPENWASPVQRMICASAENPGLANLYRVNSSLYRSAQPTKEGFEFLNKQESLANGDRPIKTVVSLRAFHSDAPLVLASSRLRLERIPFKTIHPENEDVVRFLRIATTPALQPVLVHCQHGSDRTGLMVAIYRIAFDNMQEPEATNEMIHGGFGFHKIWLCWPVSLPGYIKKLNLAHIKKEVEKLGPIN
jgi:hypothetical protein